MAQQKQLIMNKMYHVVVATEDASPLLPDPFDKRNEGILLGVFAMNKTGVSPRGSGGGPDKCEFVVSGEKEQVEAFAEDVVSRYMDYRRMVEMTEQTELGKLVFSIAEISDDPMLLEQFLMDMTDRTLRSRGLPPVFGKRKS